MQLMIYSKQYIFNFHYHTHTHTHIYNIYLHHIIITILSMYRGAICQFHDHMCIHGEHVHFTYLSPSMVEYG